MLTIYDLFANFITKLIHTLRATPFYGIVFPEKGKPTKMDLPLSLPIGFQPGKAKQLLALNTERFCRTTSVLSTSAIASGIGNETNSEPLAKPAFRLVWPWSLASWAMEYSPSLELKKPSRRMGFSLELGLRYPNCPGYGEYSIYNKALDGYIRLGIFWGKKASVLP